MNDQNYETKYHFNKDNLDNKHNPIELGFKTPSLQNVINIFESNNEKEQALWLEALAKQVRKVLY